ncbi:MAG TPA: Rv3235 family protein [Mycobacteriales bacterium]|nr:Rv3235 family protein [Mycobacteriales bacterium]
MTTPALRLVPAPPHDPPYDDELPVTPPQVVGSLALSFPQEDTTVVPLRLVPPALPPAPGGAPPDPTAWARRLAQAIVEVLSGSRPPAQLSAHATLPVVQQLERASAVALRRPDRPRQAPLVENVHVCLPRERVAEVAAVIDTRSRRRALALRLEARGGRWECTALQLC